MKTVYQTDATGVFVGETIAYPSPREPDVWLIPAGAVEIPPPAFPEGQRARWADSVWLVEPIPVPEPEPVPEPTLDERKAEAGRQIDRTIERARLHFVTGIFGQGVVYKDKMAEAQAVLAEIAGGGTPGPDDVDASGRYLYRYLRREIGTTGANLQAVAEVVAGLGSLWDDRLSPALEGLRIAGKHHAGLAADASRITTVVDLVTGAAATIVALPDDVALADQVDATIAAITWPA